MKRFAMDVGAVAGVLLAAGLVAGCGRTGPVEPGQDLANVPAASATNAGPHVWPAYYNGSVIHIMMGPGGNSASLNLLSVPACGWGLGPDVSQAAEPRGLPIMYALFISGATQMPCPGIPAYNHDMVMTTVPSDAGFNARFRVWGCGQGQNYDPSKFPFTSAAAVEAAITAGELSCSPSLGGQFAQVVGKP